MGTPKQFIEINNETMIRRAVVTATKSSAGNIFVVVGSSAETMRSELKGLRVNIIDNSKFNDGIASSIVAGIKGLPDESRSALIMTCDQPLITEHDLNELIKIFNSALCPIAAMTYKGVIGVPALFDVSVYPELLNLKGNLGAKAIIQRYADNVATYTCPHAATDCDTPEDLLHVKAIFESLSGERST
jgi:molybdenum cofactor cytidylyltransferase